MQPETDDRSSLEKARERLYSPSAAERATRDAFTRGAHDTQHEWGDANLDAMKGRGVRHVRLASYFFAGAFAFFLMALGAAGYLVYFGGNAVSVNNVAVVVTGPTAVAGGDTVPITLTVTNRNTTAIEQATIEIDFPDGTRDPNDHAKPLARYTESIGTIASGQTVNISTKAVVFGAAGTAFSMPVSLSYSAPGSNAVFVKPATYALSISSTPLSLSVDAPTETVSGKPLSLALTVRNNATDALNNVVVSANTLPFGFTLTNSSVPLTGSGFVLGTLDPGASKVITLTGILTGQDGEQRAFQFTVGTADAPGSQTLAISYMTQKAELSIAAPFIATGISINGSSANVAVLQSGARQSVTLSYTNTLATSVTNARIAVTLSGAVDESSITTTDGFFDSSTHSVVFDASTDPALASLAPGASGIGTFSFTTKSAAAAGSAPQVTFVTSVSGTRVGQTNVPEAVTASATQVAKLATVVNLSVNAYHVLGGFSNTGPVPPRANATTTYAIVWSIANQGSAIAGAAVSAALPPYVSYTGATRGTGSLSYDPSSRTVTWTVGNISPGTTAQAAFQVALLPSTSQKGSAPALTSAASFTGYDRFAAAQVAARADPPTTETLGDSGYVPTDATVQ